MSYNPLSSKEEIQLMLDVIHNNTKQQEEIYLASIRANVRAKWKATVKEIDNLLQRTNKQGHELVI